MILVQGDLWRFKADARCITTNGMVRSDGRAVMGRGCAHQARKRFPDIDLLLGSKINSMGNHVFLLRPGLYSFPVKEHWADRASLSLIDRSCRELLDNIAPDKTCVVPRPGCGNGQRRWEEVEPILARYFDDRFYVIDFA